MKSLVKWTALAALPALLMLSACTPPRTITKLEAFPGMYGEKPLSILILPPVNASTAAEAKEYYGTTIAEPLSYAGYYVFPLEVVTDILRSEGMPDTELLISAPLSKFREYFGADAVLFLRINKWDTHYFVLGGNVEVDVDFLLRSTTTGENLWKYKGHMILDTSGQSSGNAGLAGLLVAIVATAVQTAAQDYIPVARQANSRAVVSLPYGKYHPLFDKDRDAKVIVQEPEQVKEEPAAPQ